LTCNQDITSTSAAPSDRAGCGKGKLALDWWIPDNSPAQLIALTDLSTERIWLFKLNEIYDLAQQHPEGRYYLFMTIDPTARPNQQGRHTFEYEFEKYRLENIFHEFF
jgi:hypothetical protein